MHVKFSDVKRKFGKQRLMLNLTADESFKKTGEKLNKEIENALLGRDGSKVRRIATEITKIWIRQLNRS